jgi:hypothetical protein
MKQFLLCLILILSTNLNTIGQLYINEVMASNSGYNVDNQDEYEDWIEIYNASDTIINISGYYLSNEKYNKKKFQLPLKSASLNIPSKGYLVLFASNQPTKGPTHLNFTLSNQGERLYLMNPNGKKTIDNIKYKYQKADISCARQTDGGKTWKYYNKATPGKSNNSETGYKGFTSQPKLSKSGGFFDEPFDLVIKHSRRNAKIIYTTDGSVPSPANLEGFKFKYKNSYQERPSDPSNTPLLSGEIKSYEYNLKINIVDPKDKKNRLSLFSSTISRNPTYFPNYSIPKAQVIRAVAVRPGRLPSDPVTNSYFFSENGKNKFTMPIVAINMDEDDLFDYKTGIYTAGELFDKFRKNDFSEPGLCTPGNYSQKGKEWERIANLEILDKSSTQLNEKLNVRLNGNCTKSFPYKSLRIYSNENFGNFKFFNDKVNINQNNILLRANGNDFNRTIFKDVFIHQWMKPLKFPIQEYKLSVLFLNGEYWGIHEFRERIDEWYLKTKFGADQKNIDLIKIVFYGPDEISNGDDLAYNKFKAFMQNTNFADNAKYEEAKKQMDIENFIDYEIAHIYVGNIDWPQNNVRLWRLKTEKTPASSTYGHDGKWRFLFYDPERGLGEQIDWKSNDLAIAIAKPSNYMLSKLLQNKTFKAQFVARFNELLNTTFKPETTLPLYDKIQSEYAPEVPEHIKRWKTIESLATWKKNCEYVKEYITKRPPEVRRHLQEVFGVGLSWELTVKKPDSEMGVLEFYTQENPNQKTEVINETLNYNFFEQQYVTLKPKPKTGYKFAYWKSGKNILFENELILNLNSDSTFSAVFEPTDSTLSLQTKAFENNKKQLAEITISKGLSANDDNINDEINIKVNQNISLEFFELYDRKGKPIYLNQSIDQKNQNQLLKYTPVGKIIPGTYYYVYKLKDNSQIFTDFLTVTE